MKFWFQVTALAAVSIGVGVGLGMLAAEYLNGLH